MLALTFAAFAFEATADQTGFYTDSSGNQMWSDIGKGAENYCDDAHLASSDPQRFIESYKNCHDGSSPSQDQIRASCQATGCKADKGCDTICGGALPDQHDKSEKTKTADTPVKKGPQQKTAVPSSLSGGRLKPASSSGNSALDSQTCQRMAALAINCCRNPSTCMSDNNDIPIGNMGGINGACNGTASANNIAGNTNVDAGTICYQKYSACSTQCRATAKLYPGSADADAMNLAANQCDSLQSLVSQLGKQGLNNYGATTAGQNNCDGAAGASPQSMGPTGADTYSQSQTAGANPNDPYGCQANPTSAACQNCQLNPGSPTCKALIQSQQDPATKVGFQDRPKNPSEDPNSFNASSLADNVKARMQIPPTEPQQQKADPIQNGGGSGFPGAGGGSTQASLGSSGGHGYAMAGASKASGIDPNLTRSGGYSQPVGGDSGSGASGGGYVYGSGPGGAGGGRLPASQEMDLKKYLPGGELYANRGRISGISTMSHEFASKFADLWKNVSARMQEKCKLGELLDCH